MRLRVRPAKILRAFPWLVLAATLASGCAFGKSAGKSLVALVSSPEITRKEHHPVRPDARLTVLWIGHATALVQIDDKFILTDPTLEKTIGELSARGVEPGIEAKDLPPIDAVLVSHMHFDHLSLGTIDMIQGKIKRLFLPRGGMTYMPNESFESLEVPWWKTWERDGLAITACRVDHVGFRYGLDDEWMTTSFTGWMVQYHGLTVYFAGDTAYDERDFEETKKRFPNIDLALLPIGPIEPRSLMRRFHMDPREATQAFLDLGAKYMVPVHYDTFVNSPDNPGDAVRMLRASMKAKSLTDDQVRILQIGETHVIISKNPPPPAASASAQQNPAEIPGKPTHESPSRADVGKDAGAAQDDDKDELPGL